MTTFGAPKDSLFDKDGHEGQGRPALSGPRGGSTFDAVKDGPRLNAQMRRVYNAMADGCWRTLREISDETEDPEASVSARLRDFRKSQFGGYEVKRRRRADAGTWEYRLVMTERSGT